MKSGTWLKILHLDSFLNLPHVLSFQKHCQFEALQVRCLLAFCTPGVENCWHF